MPFRNHDENSISDLGGEHQTQSQYINPSTQRQVSNYIAKHYQIPKKDKSNDPNRSSGSIPRNNSELWHKRSKSQNSQYIIQKKLKKENPSNNVMSTVLSINEQPIQENKNQMVTTNESFEDQSNWLKKSTTIDNRQKYVYEHSIHKSANFGGVNRSQSNYGHEDIMTSSTWDMRGKNNLGKNRTHLKQCSNNSKQIGYHK